MSDTLADQLPSILIVDDRPSEVRAIVELLRGRADVIIREPSDVEGGDLADADLILIDYLLEEWPERENISSVSLQPMNGLALASVLRAQLTHAGSNGSTREQKPTAFALNSGHLALLAGGLPADTRAHAIARANNLEWAFDKVDNLKLHISLDDQLLSLASAVRRLPNAWPRDPDGIKEQAMQFFELSHEELWAEQAWAEIEDCHPPLHELSAATHGMALIRWMLHRILPYPCFLFDERRLAARLGVEWQELTVAFEKDQLADFFQSARFTGSLSEFLGMRWWRAGVERLLWELTDAQAFDSSLIRERLAERTGVTLKTSDIGNPLVCLNERYEPLPVFCAAENSVRIQPDDWPSFADQAWTTVELATQFPLLRNLIVHADRERFSQARGRGIEN